jgi:putative transposase
MPVRKAPASPEPKPRLRHLNETLFSSLAEARMRISAWKDDYNHHRPHSSLGNLTPSEFASNLALEKQAA